MRTVPVSNGKLFAQVDDGDYELVSQYRWFKYVNRSGRRQRTYARRWWRDENDRQRSQYMHTLVTGWSYVDHEDHDGLTNQKHNLREAGPSRNGMNARARTDGASQFKGVSRSPVLRQVESGYHAGRSRFASAVVAETGVDRGEMAAARAYDQAVIELFGEFACTDESLGLFRAERSTRS